MNEKIDFEKFTKSENAIGNLEIPQYLKRVEEEEVIKKASRAWPQIMRKIRKEGRRNDEGKVIFPEAVTSWFTVPSEGREEGIDLTCIDNASCRHALKGGCTICDYGGYKRNEDDNLRELSDKALEHIKETNKNYEHAYINLVTPGSLFDKLEMPRKELFRILNEIAKYKKTHKSVQFDTETRLEFIDEKLLTEIRKILGDDVGVEIGYGLESSNKLIREGAINKNLPDDYIEKITLMRKYGISPINHILIKPPFVTEKEALDDAVNSINNSLDNKIADRVIVMATNIKENTLSGKMKEDGLYEKANVWTIIEIMKKIGFEKAKNCKFLGFSNSPTIKTDIVTGCDEFNEKLMPLLLNYRSTKEDYDSIINMADILKDCPSRKEFEKKINEKIDSSLAERIAAGIDFYGKKFINKNYNDF